MCIYGLVPVINFPWYSVSPLEMLTLLPDTVLSALYVLPMTTLWDDTIIPPNVQMMKLRSKDS